jgi:ferritin-like metal-binding protein YciE
VSKLGNLAAGLLTSAAPDTVVKNAIADYAAAHFEIACYTLLIATATELGEASIAVTCGTILKEEQAKAKAIEEQLRGINATYLTSLEDDPKAARKDKKTALVRRRVVGSKGTAANG